MRLEETSWNSFRIPIEPNQGETETQYLIRIRDYLTDFYTTYAHQEAKDTYNPFVGTRLESLVDEWNFSDFHLEGIDFCDVKFYVGTPKDNYGFTGIGIYSHADYKEYRTPMIEFLKRKWQEFECGANQDK